MTQKTVVTLILILWLLVIGEIFTIIGQLSNLSASVLDLRRDTDDLSAAITSLLNDPVWRAK